MAELSNSDVTITGIDIIRGLPVALKPRVDTWETPGLDGYGAQLLGLGDAEFELIVIKYCVPTGGGSGADGANDAANSFIEAVNSLQGSEVAVQDDYGDSYSHCLVVHVETNKCKTPCLYQGARAIRVEIPMKMLTCTADDGGGSGEGG